MAKPRNLRAFRHDLAILKRKGLVNIDVRKAQPTKHYKSLLRKNADVISGRATVVKIKGARKRIASNIETRKQITKAKVLAEGVLGGARAKRGRVIVQSTGRPVRYEEKTGRFVSSMKVGGRTVKTIVAIKGESLEELEKQGFTFSVPFDRGKAGPVYRHWTSAAEMQKHMKAYERRYKDWREHVVYSKPPEDYDEEDDASLYPEGEEE